MSPTHPFSLSFPVETNVPIQWKESGIIPIKIRQRHMGLLAQLGLIAKAQRIFISRPVRRLV
jgi:hypothetical protein